MPADFDAALSRFLLHEGGIETLSGDPLARFIQRRPDDVVANVA